MSCWGTNQREKWCLKRATPSDAKPAAFVVTISCCISDKIMHGTCVRNLSANTYKSGEDSVKGNSSGMLESWEYTASVNKSQKTRIY